MRISKIKFDKKILINSPSDIFYYTGFLPREQAFLLMDRKPILFLHPFEKCKIRIAKEDIKNIGKYLEGEIGIDEKSLPASFLMKFKNTKFFPASHIIKKARAIKDAEEIERIKVAVKITKKIFDELEVCGSEQDIAWQIRQMVTEKKVFLAFDPIVASGPNTLVIHHQPGKRIIKKDDMVIVDFGVRYQGYCSDLSRTFCAKPKKGQIKIIEKVKEIQEKIMDMIGHDVKKSEIDAAYKRFVGKPVHAWGHGIGIDVHEELGDRLLAGMVIAIEPGIYKKPYGCRIEDIVLIKKSGVKIL
ncbi:MAG: Xaa-Pro peptidase family protein [Candidatus Aenigmatarchaeota archaeon]